MLVLGIETSCDETAAAVVRDGRVLSSRVLSQTALHAPYGGVVPEIASRSHLESLPGLLREALSEAGVGWGDVDAVAATRGPGLASSLLVGLWAAKGLALRLGRPLIAVNHLQAHIYSAFMKEGRRDLAEACPFAALVISGGHTCLVRVERFFECRLLGQTIDDAAGEAFDKGASLLGLGYPGGPAMEKTARDGRRDAVLFPRGRLGRDSWAWETLDPTLCFSFSGLKTALLYHLRSGAEPSRAPDLAASYQEAIVDAVVERCRRAVRGGRLLAAGGGVTLNGRLRERLGDMAREEGVELYLAEARYCGDNAAMIAGLAERGGGRSGVDAMEADAEPNLTVEQA